MRYCIENTLWNLKEAFSEGRAICKPAAIFGLKTPILIGLFTT